MVLMDGLFRLLAFALAAPAQHHVESHGEEEQAASNAERGQRDTKLRQQPIADEGNASQDHSRQQAGIECDAPMLSNT